MVAVHTIDIIYTYGKRNFIKLDKFRETRYTSHAELGDGRQIVVTRRAACVR